MGVRAAEERPIDARGARCDACGDRATWTTWSPELTIYGCDDPDCRAQLADHELDLWFNANHPRVAGELLAEG